MKFREFNLPGYNQHRCFSDLGWDKHDGRWTRVNPENLSTVDATGILQHLPVSICPKRETLELGEHSGHRRSHSKGRVPKATPSKDGKVNSSENKKAQGQGIPGESSG